MSQLLHLAAESDLDRLEKMVAAFHEEEGFDTSKSHRLTSLRPILSGTPHGAVWLIGPRMSPVGYIAVSFGWSIELGGLDGMIDEFWIRSAVRGRGMGTEALNALQTTLRDAGVKALSLEVDGTKETAVQLYHKAGFAPRHFHLMTWSAHGSDPAV